LNGRLLSYVIGSEVEPPDETKDATFGKPGSCYGIRREAIEERAPHGTQAYQVENDKVF
jgi:hypothetical protein